MHAELAARGEEYLADFLSNRGYPEEALARDRRIRGGGRPDFVVVDPQSREVIGVIELAISSISSPRNAKNQHQRLAAYRAGIGNLDLPAYLILVDEDRQSGEVSLLFYEDGRENLIEIPPTSFPDFDTLRTQVLALSATATEAEKKATVTTLQRVVCWLLVLAAELILLSFLRLWTPSWEQLALISAFGVLTVLPFFKKLSVLGVAFEHAVPDE
jgi:hypothetical protein